MSTSESEIEKRLKSDPHLEERLDEILVTKGKRRPIIDTIRSIFSLPHKLLLWDSSVGSGELHKDAETAAKLFLAEGGATSTHISVNEYNPKIIWQRTFQNDKASILTKITYGVLHALIYTVIPSKLFYKGGDHYNPFADTIVLYSDNLDVALHEAGHAVDFSEKQRQHIDPGLYMLGRYFFPIMLYQEAVATGKAFKFTKEHGASEDVRSSYALLFPAFGTYLAASIFMGNAMINWTKKKMGKDETRLSKWMREKDEGIRQWKIFSELKKEGYGKKVTKLSKKAMKFGIILPVIIAAHIVGRVMGANVDTGNEEAINPKLFKNEWD